MPSYDAAPLPRLGEVFFDVRGHSRSMRLSWYGDTGVAVLSIWQGDRCSGTFRLPADELSRMVATLQRGPDRDQPARDQPDSAQFDSPQFDSPQFDRDGYDPRDGYGPEDGGPRDGYGPADGYGSGSHAVSYPPPPVAPQLPPPGPGYGSPAPGIHPSDPLGLDYRGAAPDYRGAAPDYRGAEAAGYRDGGRPDRAGAHRPADDSRTDLGAAAGGDLPDYLAAPSRDYRPADPEGYPADDIRSHPADDRRNYPAADTGYPAADTGGYPAADRRDYAPGATPEYRRGASGPAADDRAAEAYPSWDRTDSGAHSRPRGWPEDYPDDESLPRGRAPSGPRQDRRLAEDRHDRNLVPRQASRPPQH
jgi:hypothetical protein